MSKPDAGAATSAAATTTPATGAAAPFRAAAARRRFGALRDPAAPIFFDNAAGAQVPDEVAAAVREHLERRNVQRGGRYDRSRAVDAMIGAARRRVAAFVNAEAPEEIVFGLNSTSLIRIVADALRPKLAAGDRVVVTELDHEANIGPWLRLEAQGIEPRWWRVRGGTTARLELGELEAILHEGRVRVVALPLASNASGRIVDVKAAAALARAHGAWTFVDAVHYAPHAAIDVRSLGADFLAFSGYKIFGPHVGFLWGRRALLDSLEPAREHFIPASSPYAYEAGTQCYEAIAGMSAAVHYLSTVESEDATPRLDVESCDDAEVAALRARLGPAMARVREHEAGLAARLLEAARSLPGIEILGDPDPARVAERLPTLTFRLAGMSAATIVDRLAAHAIQGRDGHMYAPRLLRAAGFDPDAGVARVSLCHYNTAEEIERFAAALGVAPR